MNIEEILKIEPYSLDKTTKHELLSSYLSNLTEYHYIHCEPYRKILTQIGFDPKHKYLHTELPFLPAQLFKTNKLISTPNESTVKTLYSSGTSGLTRTHIYLDKENATNQTKVLVKIVSSFLGNKRLPMMIIDSDSIIADRNQLSARAAGVIGFSLLGSKPVYVLNENMKLNIELLNTFLNQHEGERFLVFGFTFMVYQHFYKTLLDLNLRQNLSNAILIHGGGWKKLEREAVSQQGFRNKLKDVCGLQNIHDYYGMAEQAGSIYIQCQFGHYHASVFSDVIIRRAIDFSIAGIGEEGIIQVVSLLPTSYPGHSILTSDKGILRGEDDCPCKRLGKYFTLTGRLKQTELRGCSDSYE